MIGRIVRYFLIFFILNIQLFMYHFKGILKKHDNFHTISTLNVIFIYFLSSYYRQELADDVQKIGRDIEYLQGLLETQPGYTIRNFNVIFYILYFELL